MNNKIGFWTFMSILMNVILIYSLCTSAQEVLLLKDQKTELRIQNNRLVSDSAHFALEIKRLNEIIEFHKQLNGVQ